MSRKISWMLPLPFLLILILLLQRAQAHKDSSPRERLEQYVAKPQRSPIDDTLQKKIIKTAREFTWCAEGYFNFGVTLEASVRLDNAIAELKRYLLAEANIKESRAARDRIYAMAGRKELAVKTALAKADTEGQEEGRERKAKKRAGVKALEGRWRGTNWWERGSRRGGPFSIEFVAIIREKEIWFLPTRARVGYLRGIIDADQVENIRWETGYFTRPPPAWVREIAPLGSWFLDLGPPRSVQVEITGSPDRIRYKMPMYSAHALDLGDNRYYFLKDAWEFFDLRK